MSTGADSLFALVAISHSKGNFRVIAIAVANAFDGPDTRKML